MASSHLNTTVSVANGTQVKAAPRSDPALRYSHNDALFVMMLRVE